MNLKPNLMTVEQWGFYKGMLTMCGVVISWCLIYEVMLRFGMVAACK